MSGTVGIAMHYLVEHSQSLCQASNLVSIIREGTASERVRGLYQISPAEGASSCLKARALPYLWRPVASLFRQLQSGHLGSLWVIPPSRIFQTEIFLLPPYPLVASLLVFVCRPCRSKKSISNMLKAVTKQLCWLKATSWVR